MAALHEKIGQMFIVGVQGEALGREERLLIEQYDFGGFILFSRNCAEATQILSLCRSLWETTSDQPPFIAIDQEGGRVHRLPPPFTHFPPAARIGEKNDGDLAYRAGQATAAELALVGINLDFAPVLDVNSNPANPIIGERAFGSDPARVIHISRRWMAGLRDGGVIPCGKHFPGHGDTDKDSHLDLPRVERSLDKLRAVELPPFAHACRANIEALMTAHVIYGALDPKLPATLSHAIVTGLLRRELGYDGVVFSDDMEMKAIADNYSIEEAVGLSLHAGIDGLLYCHEISRAVEACEFLIAAAENDAAVRARVEESYRRITRLKKSLRNFSGASEDELVRRLRKLEHQRLVEAIQGSL